MSWIGFKLKDIIAAQKQNSTVIYNIALKIKLINIYFAKKVRIKSTSSTNLQHATGLLLTSNFHSQTFSVRFIFMITDSIHQKIINVGVNIIVSCYIVHKMYTPN